GIIAFVLLLLFCELFARGVYYQRLSASPLALIQVLKDGKGLFHHHEGMLDTRMRRLQKNHYLVRPGLSKTENDEINREHIAANQAVYEPWVEFAFRDIHSKYVNVDNHMRLSLPARSDPASKTPFRIFFLGGSTTYGYNVTDAETIPSCFVKAYHQKYPQGRPIEVVNLGMPFYFSYQELMLLTDKIFRDEKPDLVIMLD